MKKRVFIVILALFVLLVPVYAIDPPVSVGTNTFLYDFDCNDLGVLSFHQNPPISPVVVERVRDGKNVTIPGEWTLTRFTTEEAVMVDSGEYILHDPISGSKSFFCPGLVFSCTVVGLNAESCTKYPDKIVAEFTLFNASIADLEYDFSGPGKKTFHFSARKRSTELKDLSIVTTGKGKHTIEVQQPLVVKDFSITHSDCIGINYVHSKVDCFSPDTGEPLSPGEQMQCGKLLGPRQRVSCRLDLDSETKNVSESFFSNECTAQNFWSEEECIFFHQSTHHCFSEENGRLRVSCVQNELGILNITTQKEECGLLIGIENRECLQEINKKIKSQVVFKISNLEYQAEMFFHEGKLDREKVTDFLITMQSHKFAFLSAKSFDERVHILDSARKNWAKLLVSMEDESD